MRFDELRIIENLVSRTVTPYEYALNIARLIRITKDAVGVNGSDMRSPIMSQVAERLGVHRFTVQKNQTISNLVPQLGQLLNDKVISQFAAPGIPQKDAITIALRASSMQCPRSPTRLPPAARRGLG